MSLTSALLLLGLLAGFLLLVLLSSVALARRLQRSGHPRPWRSPLVLGFLVVTLAITQVFSSPWTYVLAGLALALALAHVVNELVVVRSMKSWVPEEDLEEDGDTAEETTDPASES